jgi:hypothetical protein
MALSATDLRQIKILVTDVVRDAVAPLVTKEELAKELVRATAPLATKEDLDRSEARITASMSLLERDTLSRLDEHEIRIKRLENARTTSQ